MNKLFNIGFLLSLFLVFFNSCKEADELVNVVYMTGTEKTTLTRVSIDGPTEFGISATCTEKVNKDVRVEFSINSSLVDSYNSEKGTSYRALPEGVGKLEKNVSVIKSGSNISEAIMFLLTTTEGLEEGISYLVPITLVSADGYQVLESCRTVYVLLNQVIVTKALSLANYTRFYVPKFKENAELKSIPKISMECRVKVNKFQTRDPFISSVMGIEYDENFLLRFGDVTIDNNQLQLTAKDQVTPSDHFETGKWYHIATVFDGNTIYMYINGELAASKAATRGPVNLYDGGDFNFGYSYDGRYLDGAISEARVWTKALTQVEIQENMCYVSPDTEGLLAYWRFNEGEGYKSVDCTGHGYDAVSYSGRNAKWIEGVKCPGE